ncbi:MAG: leucine--tRNA ligase, partial [Pseudomonadales bacterium]
AKFIKQCKKQSLAEADMATMEKRGIDTGLLVTHPLNGRRLPLWIANYVLMDYGSGAVMAVPAHDERDFAFAQAYTLPIEQVVASTNASDPAFSSDAWQEWYARKSETVSVNSAPFDGLDFDDCSRAITDALIEKNAGERSVNYRLRDWGVSRQRYWGAPIPMLNLPEGGEIPVPADKLPVLLPEDVVMDGVHSPIKTDGAWRKVNVDGCAAERETDTFDTFMESSWYYARFTCPDYDAGILDSERANYWLPVDQYVGGIEHAILHLLYARFYHKLLRDDGHVACDEPFKRLLCQGMVLAESYFSKRSDGGIDWFNPSDVEVVRDDKGRVLEARHKTGGQQLEIGGMTKMSKSKNNGVDPQTTIDRYGADTVRVFTMFAAPPEQTLEWHDDGVAGAQRFLKRLWNFCQQHREGLQDAIPALNDKGHGGNVLQRADSDALAGLRLDIHSALQKALEDFERNQFNTVIAACMSMLNALYKVLPDHLSNDNAVQRGAAKNSAANTVAAEGIGLLLRLLAPIAPHICHTLWIDLGYGADILDAPWPLADQAAMVRSELELVVQVNGKVRARLQVAADADRQSIEALALAQENAQKFIDGKTVRKVIVVPGKLVNIVAN